MLRYFPFILLVSACVILTTMAFLWVREWEEERLLTAFHRTASDQVLALQHKIESTLDHLNSLGAFYAASREVTRENFRVFVTPVINKNKTIQALEWIPKVPAEKRAVYQLRVREKGHPNFEFRERKPGGGMKRAGKREVYYPVYFVEPLAGNEKAFGFDLGSESTRLAALEEAVNTGQMVISGRITLVQETGSQFGFLVFLPVYNKQRSLNTVRERNENLAGFVLGVFRMGDLVRASFPQTSEKPELEFFIFDLFAPKQRQLLFPGLSKEILADELKFDLQFNQTIKIGNREWLVVIGQSGGGFYHKILSQSWLVLFFGLLFSGTLGAYLKVNLNRQFQIESTVRQRTEELTNVLSDLFDANESLQESEQRIRSVHDTVSDGIITIDEQGLIESINPAVEMIFGYTQQELLGKNVRILMPDPDRSKHGQYLERYMNTGEARVIGIGREVTGLRKDSSTFPLDLSIGEIRLGETRLFTGVVRDITERKKVEQMKNEFIAVVSHELRTPLTSILGSLEILKTGVVGDLGEEAMMIVNISFQSSQRLVRLINEILDIEKLESKKSDLVLEPFDLPAMVKVVIESSLGFGEKEGVSFAFRNYIEGVRVNGDRDKLMQVLTNLLSNAAKFSPPGSEVEVSILRKEGNIRVAVKDRGIGIPEDFHARIFQKFSQVDSTDTRGKGGTGLGLAICKTIMEKHNGSIGFDSKTGRGSTFYFDLPEAG